MKKLLLFPLILLLSSAPVWAMEKRIPITGEVPNDTIADALLSFKNKQPEQAPPLPSSDDLAQKVLYSGLAVFSPNKTYYITLSREMLAVYQSEHDDLFILYPPVDQAFFIDDNTLLVKFSHSVHTIYNNKIYSIDLSTRRWKEIDPKT